MALILVTYDLNRGTQNDYAGLYAELKDSPGWWHHLESTWILSTTESPEEVLDRLRPHIHSKDRLLVIDVTEQDRQGWLPRRAWDWIRKHNHS